MPEPHDLRRPDPDETELSQDEVRHGTFRGLIPLGPRAHARAFGDVFVLERRRVEVWQIGPRVSIAGMWLKS